MHYALYNTIFLIKMSNTNSEFLICLFRVQNNNLIAHSFELSWFGRLEFVVSASDLQEFDVEDQSGAARDDAAGPALSVSQMGWDGKLALLSNAHIQQTLKRRVKMQFEAKP